MAGEREGKERSGDPRAPELSVPRRTRGERLDPRSFFGKPPSQLLELMLDGDPLGLGRLAMDRCDELALMVSSGRLHARAVARAAYAGSRYRGQPPLEEWTAALVERALSEILEEDRHGARRGLPIVDEEDYRILTRRIELSPEAARAACVAFNDLPGPVRRSYFALSDGVRTVAEIAEAEGVSDAQVRGWVAEALRTLLERRGDE